MYERKEVVRSYGDGSSVWEGHGELQQSLEKLERVESTHVSSFPGSKSAVNCREVEQMPNGIQFDS